jgi:hypothetical protein
MKTRLINHNLWQCCPYFGIFVWTHKKIRLQTKKVGLLHFDICILISPFGFCCVWTFAYALPSSIGLTRSEICLSFNGPSSLSEVIVPCANTPLLGPEDDGYT